MTRKPITTTMFLAVTAPIMAAAVLATTIAAALNL